MTPGKRPDFFIGLLDAVLPGNQGSAVMLKAYFDASERPGGQFCVAGFAFPKAQAKKFAKEWWGIFGKYGGCHMKELAHPDLGGRFKGLTNTETGNLLKQGVARIRARFSYGVVVSCNLNEIHELLPVWIDGCQHAYPVCCHMAMHSLGTLVRASSLNEDIAYFFESGDQYADAAHRFMNEADKSPELKKTYAHASHTFIEKDKAIPLEAADVLAWEFTKYWDETREKGKRNMRKSLAALFADGSNPRELDRRYRMLHLTGQPLRTWCEKVSALGLKQLHEAMLANGAYDWK